MASPNYISYYIARTCYVPLGVGVSCIGETCARSSLAQEKAVIGGAGGVGRYQDTRLSGCLPWHMQHHSTVSLH